MPDILCPVCRSVFAQSPAQWRCANGHCFDVARQGYVNLLPVTQKHALHPGDTMAQTAARRAFLSAGYYAPLAQAVCRQVQAFSPRTVLDVGCGEGYYTGLVEETLPEAWVMGLDISKDAVRLAAGRYKNCRFLCATAAHLPFPDGSFDLIMSLFALTVPGEFARVLRPGGHLVQVLAGEDHLLELKSVIYPEVFRREKDTVPQLPGFALVSTRQISFPVTVEGQQIQHLLAMTPHYWRITKEGAARLAELTRLDDRVSAVMNVYRREAGCGFTFPGFSGTMQANTGR